MKRLVFILILLVNSCGIYSFSGTSIQNDVDSICIAEFEYKALKVNPNLSNELSEALRKRFRQMTRLEQVDEDGDLELTGEISNYAVSASSIGANDTPAQNRLTVSVKINFVNNKHPQENVENKTFSAYADFDAMTALDAVESTLCAEIIDKLIEDIFNATVAQW